MINELHSLSTAIARSGIQTQKWHREYLEIPNISPKAPCVRIQILDGKIIDISAVDPRLGGILRKYGTNQGSYPCMNLTPLYRISDETVKEKLRRIRPEDLTTDKIAEIRTWCTKNNWEQRNFQKQYRRCIEKKASELACLVPRYEPLQLLYRQSNFFLQQESLFQELEATIFRMLHDRKDVTLALYILFQTRAVEGYYLSIAFESPVVIEKGIPAVSEKFTMGLNNALLNADQSEIKHELSSLDAFGLPFEPINEKMPKVNLTGGFTAILRTMYKDHPCQKRYGLIEDASFPISRAMRGELHAALGWLSSKERRDITWIKTEEKEILFAYPSKLPEIPISFTRIFDRSSNREEVFEESARQFISELRRGRNQELDSKAEYIQLFILRLIDRARTKVIYTRQTNSHELEKCCEAWTLGCSENLPKFPFGQPAVPYPLEVSDILNRFWKQNGDVYKSSFKPVPKYHGLELLMEPRLPVASDMQNLAQKAMTIGSFLGRKLAAQEMGQIIWGGYKSILALMGLFLYRVGTRKDAYMENIPYLYGQLLKISDELHALYCMVVRKGDLPPQLAGGSLYQAAAEAPLRTLNLLGQRIMPYYTWAKSYRHKGIEEEKKESGRADRLYSMYERTASKLYENWTQQTRFNDEEKAQFFIGYLAAFPRSERATGSRTEEEQVNE